MESEKRLDLIDRNKLKEKLQEHHDFFVDGVGGFRYLTPKDKARVDEITNCIAEIVNAPTVDAMEVVHARWVKHKPKPEAMRAWHRQGIGKAMSENSIFWTCSCCEEWGTPRYNYCPNCGAKMDGGNEDDSKRMARKA